MSSPTSAQSGNQYSYIFSNPWDQTNQLNQYAASPHCLDPIGRKYFRQPPPLEAVPTDVASDQSIDYQAASEAYNEYVLQQEDNFYGAWSALLSHLPLSMLTDMDTEDNKRARQTNRDRLRYLLHVLPVCLEAEPWEHVILPHDALFDDLMMQYPSNFKTETDQSFARFDYNSPPPETTFHRIKPLARAWFSLEAHHAARRTQSNPYPDHNQNNHFQQSRLQPLSNSHSPAFPPVTTFHRIQPLERARFSLEAKSSHRAARRTQSNPYPSHHKQNNNLQQSGSQPLNRHSPTLPPETTVRRIQPLARALETRLSHGATGRTQSIPHRNQNNNLQQSGSQPPPNHSPTLDFRSPGNTEPCRLSPETPTNENSPWQPAEPSIHHTSPDRQSSNPQLPARNDHTHQLKKDPQVICDGLYKWKEKYSEKIGFEELCKTLYTPQCNRQASRAKAEEECFKRLLCGYIRVRKEDWKTIICSNYPNPTHDPQGEEILLARVLRPSIPEIVRDLCSLDKDIREGYNNNVAMQYNDVTKGGGGKKLKKQVLECIFQISSPYRDRFIRADLI